MSLFEKIRKVEALIERASSDGERRAAELAKQRLQNRVQELPIECKVCAESLWEKQLFRAICLKHNQSPYRYARQKYTTTMVRVTKTIMDKIIWPEYEKYSEILREMVNEITDELITKIHRDDEDETVIAGEISSSRRS